MANFLGNHDPGATVGLAGRPAEGLRVEDQVVLPAAFDPAAVGAWRQAAAAHAAGRLAPGRIGRSPQQEAATRGGVRCWVAAGDPDAALAGLHATLEALRLALDRVALLGLRSLEVQLARYAPGAGYARHRERFADGGARVVSLLLHLNAGWDPADGGALRLHATDGSHRDVLPEGGTLVAFLSAAVEHEVLATRRERWSVAAWLRDDAPG